MIKSNKIQFALLSATGYIVMCSVGNAGSYGYSVSDSYSNKALFGNYSTYKMEGYNFRSHTSLNRVNHHRSFTLHRVYDKDKRSYRALRKLKKK